jgi:hypothetical protein
MKNTLKIIKLLTKELDSDNILTLLLFPDLNVGEKGIINVAKVDMADISHSQCLC